MSLLRPFYAPVFKATDDNGLPLVGGKLYTYASGTTTPLATFQDGSGTTPQTNPIILDADGQAKVYLSSAVYRFVLQDANGVEQWSADQIDATTAFLASSITGVIALSNLPDYPLSRVTIDQDTALKFMNQTVQAAGTANPQRHTLNVLEPLTAADNGTNLSTDIGLANTAVTPGAYTKANVTVDAKGRITAAANGSEFPARVDNSNGSAITFPDGTIFQWGISGASPMNTNKGSVAVTFPVAFTVLPSITLSCDNNPDGTGIQPIECHASNVSLSGFTANFTADVIIGGGGASNITNVVHAGWHAKGH